jgi:hypothetical protein
MVVIGGIMAVGQRKIKKKSGERYLYKENRNGGNGRVGASGNGDKTYLCQ